MTPDELTTQLQQAFGAELRAVVLYGSAAAGEHIPDRSDYNVLVIVDSLSLDRLEAKGAVTRAWVRAGNPAPLALTTQEWRASADIFPMEYADILERHKVLHGQLPTDGIRVSPNELRHELEHQAMGKLLQLRRGILAAGGEERAQLELLGASLSTIMVLFRATARLHGQAAPTNYEELSDQVAALGGFDATPFRAVVRHVRGGERLSGKERVAAVLSGYLDGMQRLVAHVDRFRPAGGPPTTR